MIRRNTLPCVTEALSDTPVVVIQGPRQCGKSTLSRQASSAPYVTLDDSLARASAATTPASFLRAYPDQVVIDEVQREPGLFRELKKLVDEDRRAGRFLLTGSANVLLVPKIADSLAGRMEVVSLWPLSQGEIEGFVEDFAAWAFSGKPVPQVQPEPDLETRIKTGGFPEPLSRASASRRNAWFESYQKALIERDVRDLAEIDGLSNLPNLLRACAQRPYDVLNTSALSRQVGIPGTTLTRYLSLLQGVFLLKEIPAWSTTDAKTAKTPRLLFVDSGVGSSISPTPHLDLATIEAFLAMEFIKQTGWSQESFEVMHFRSLRHHSLPIVLRHRDGRVVAISVIDRPEPEPADLRAIEFFAEVAGDSFARGVILHRGERCSPVHEKLCALPISAVWRIGVS